MIFRSLHHLLWKTKGHTSNSRRYLAPLFALSCSTCLANKSIWIGGCFAIPGVVLFWRCISAGSDDFLDERDNNRSCSTEPSPRLQEKDNSIFLLQQFKDYLLKNLSRWITLKSNLFLSKWENQYRKLYRKTNSYKYEVQQEKQHATKLLTSCI